MGLIPAMPQNAAGPRMEPPVSEPVPPSTSPAATAAPVPEDDPAVMSLKAALAKRTEMGILGFNYQQERSFDVLQTAAGNEGNAGSVMSAGLGLGMGAALGGPMAGAMAQLTPQMQPAVAAPSPLLAPSGSGSNCRKCSHAMPAGARFCPECGNKAAAFCTQCGTDLGGTAKFCSNCGQQVAT